MSKFENLLTQKSFL